MTIDAPIHTNETNLQRVLNAGLPVALVFWRQNCAPCDQLTPILDRLARSYSGRALIVKINSSEEPTLVSRYKVSSIPTLVFIKDGHNVASAVGAAGEMELTGWLNHLTNGGARPPLPSGPSVSLYNANGRGATATPPSHSTGKSDRSHVVL